MIDRKIVFAYVTPHNTTNVVNYDYDNKKLNDFLSAFDVWGSKGYREICSDKAHMKITFEGLPELYDLMHTDTFLGAFHKFGVTFTSNGHDVFGLD